MFWTLGYVHVQLNFLPVSTFDSAHMSKIPGSPHPAQLQCSRSAAWERGYSQLSWLYNSWDSTWGNVSVSDIASSTVHVYARHGQAS